MNIRMRTQLFLALLVGPYAARSFAFIFMLTASSASNADPVPTGGIPSVVYEDTFSADGFLAGRSVESGTNTWIARPEMITTNGVALPGATSAGKNALLPFVPQSGFVYRLSADFSSISGGFGAVGFVANSTPPVGDELFWNLIDTTSPWMYITTNGTVATLSGPGGQGYQGFTGLEALGRMMIELDTRGSNWIADYYFNGILLRTQTYSGSLGINYVAFGGNPIADLEVDCFSLEAVPEYRETVVYKDSFSVDGTLSGRIAESGFGSWIARPELITTNGVVLPSSTLEKAALLPFVPRKNRLYYLSADVSITSGNWVAMGFASSETDPVGSEYFWDLVDSEAPWMYVNASSTVAALSGPGGQGYQGFPGLGTQGQLMVALDTRETNWTAVYYFDGIALRTNVFSGSLAINYIGIGVMPTSDATIDNVRLEVVEPSAELSINNDYRPINEIWGSSYDLDFTRSHVDEWSLHNWMFASFSDVALSNIMQTASANSFFLSMEFGGLQCDTNAPDQSGEIAADYLVSLLNRVDRLGGQIKRVYLDHPFIPRYLDNPDFGLPAEPKKIPSGMSWNESIREVADFLERAQQSYPGIEFWMLPNFVNYGWKGERASRTLTGTSMSVGDFYQEYIQVLAACKSRGIHLDGVLIDYPYSNAAGLVDESGTVFYNGPPDEFDWMARIRDLEYETEIRGLDFGIINNNPVGASNADQFYVKSLKYIDTYRGAPYHGTPAIWAPWSWYHAPTHYAPEYTMIGNGSSNYTIGVLASAIVELIKPEDEVIGWYWGFSDNGCGVVGRWAWGDLLPPVFDAGFLKTVSTGTDGWIGRNDLSINGSSYQTVEMALAVDGGTTLRLYYQVDDGAAWYEAPSTNLNTDGQTHVYSFDLQGSQPWTGGTVTAICLDPTDIADASCWLDYIWIKP